MKTTIRLAVVGFGHLGRSLLKFESARVGGELVRIRYPWSDPIDEEGVPSEMETKGVQMVRSLGLP